MLKEKLTEIGLTDEQIKDVMANIAENYVLKEKFDKLNSQLETANAELETKNKELEEFSKVDVDGLNAEIKRLQEENKANMVANETVIKKLKIDNAVEKALINAKARNPKAVKALLELDDAELEGNSIKGLDKQIKKLMEAEDSSFLFENSNKHVELTGIRPSDGISCTKNKEDMTYTELCAYYENNNTQI